MYGLNQRLERGNSDAIEIRFYCHRSKIVFGCIGFIGERQSKLVMIDDLPLNKSVLYINMKLSSQRGANISV